MSNPPAVLQGTAQTVQPTRIAAAHAASAHRFFNVIRDILHKSGYHTEGELLAALDAVAQYENKVVTSGDLKQVSTDNDRAAVEDVSKRIAPQSGIGNLPVMTPAPIDYDQLAAALVRAQAAAAAQQTQQTTSTPEVPAT